MRASVVFALIVLGCSNGRVAHPDANFGDVGSRLDAAGVDAASAIDSGRDAASAIDSGRDAASTNDSGRDAASTAHDAGRDATSASDTGAGGLDPALDVPPAANPSCATPGSFGECALGDGCRFFSATEGRCESCGPCGHLFDPCTSGNQCDILFVCFQGRCTNFCTLGTSECGPPADCIDIGHPTRGACRPH